MRASIRLALAVLGLSAGTTWAQEATQPAEAAKEAAPAAVEPAPATAPLPPAVAAPEPAAAATPSAPPAAPRIGFTLGIRAALALPFGTFAGLNTSSETRAFDEELDSAIPLTLEVGLRVTPRVTLGGYFSYGPAKVKEDALMGGCAESSSECSGGWTRRFGGQLLFQLTEPSTFTPWIGAGIGYEWLGFDFKTPDGTVHVTYKGMEQLNVQLGGDYRASEKFYVGPYAAMTFAKFKEMKLTAPGESLTLDFSEPKVHSWLMLGLRGGFDL